MNQQTTSETVPAQPTPQAVPRRLIDYATIALLEEWMVEDATDDPELIRLAEEELHEFKKALNENRAVCGERLLFP